MGAQPFTQNCGTCHQFLQLRFDKDSGSYVLWSSSSYLFFDNNTTQKNHKNSHTIGGLPEKPYSSLTGRPSKKNKLSTNNIIIQ